MATHILTEGSHRSRDAASFGAYSIAFFFLFMCLYPSQYQLYRGMSLAVWVGGSVLIVGLQPFRWKISRDILLVSSGCLVISAYGLAHGLIEGNLGASRSVTVYMLWPLLFIWIIGLPYGKNALILMMKTIIVASFTASFSIVLYVIFVAVNPVAASSINFFNTELGYVYGSVKVSSAMTPLLLFFLPFGLCLLLNRARLSAIGLSLPWIYLLTMAVTLTIINVFVTGRAGFWVVAVLALPLALFFSHHCVEKSRYLKVLALSPIFAIAVSSLAYAITLYFPEINFEVYYELLIEKIFEADNPGSTGHRRYTQVVAVLPEVISSPLLGYGFGAVIPNYETGDIWQIELSYLLLIFQVGVIGFLVYLFAIGWLVRILVRISRLDIEFALLAAPVLAGMVGFLIGNSTNPLLSKFDFLWVIFLPLALANYGYRKRSIVRSSPPFIDGMSQVSS